MQDRAAFAAGMGSLAVNARLELAPEQAELFWAMLADLSDQDFTQAVFRWIRTSKFFPAVSELREKVTPYQPPTAEAGLAFERVCKAGVYNPTGYRWNIRTIAESIGQCAAEAFAAAGGSRGFEYEQGEDDLPFLRKRFVEAYSLAVQAQRAGRDLIPATSTPPALSPVRGLIAAVADRLAMPERQPA